MRVFINWRGSADFNIQPFGVGRSTYCREGRLHFVCVIITVKRTHDALCGADVHAAAYSFERVIQRNAF